MERHLAAPQRLRVQRHSRLRQTGRSINRPHRRAQGSKRPTGSRGPTCGRLTTVRAIGAMGGTQTDRAKLLSNNEEDGADDADVRALDLKILFGTLSRLG